jgi:hypothetical protein
MAKKITIKKTRTLKKNFLKENCGVPAAPMVQNMPAAGDVTTMSPEAAYDAGWNDAINEIMAVVAEMMPGVVPVEMAPPADIAHMDQLEES